MKTMIPKMNSKTEGGKLRTFFILIISLISSLSFGQNAIDYFPTQEGCVWKYDVYSLDNSNNIIATSKSVRCDSLIGQGNYKGKDSYLCLTNWNLSNDTISTSYHDSVLYSFNGPIASEFSHLFSLPYKGEFIDLLVAEIRDKIIGWYDYYQFDKPLNSEYQLLKYDTSIVYHYLGYSFDVDISTTINGRRVTDETVTTSIGNFLSKKFIYTILINLSIHLDGRVYRIPFAEIPISHWINDNRWIVKEFRPTTVTTNLIEFGLNPITIAGISRTLSGFNLPHPGVPVLKSPQNNSNGVSVNPTLSWDASNYASSYQIQLATDSSFENIVYEDSTISNTSVVINNLAYGTNFFWHVKAKNISEISEWSDFWQFTTEIEDFLSVSPSNLNIASTEGSTSTFTVSSNVSWTAASNQTWLSISPGSGTGNGNVTLTATVNPTITERTATITISGVGVASKTINVNQAAGSATLAVSTNTLNIAALESSTASFGIISNTTWNVSSDQSWLSFNHSTGTGNGSVTITSQANLTIIQRTATITVSATGATSKTITVTQAAGDATLSVSSTALNVAATGGSTATLAITSNTSWTIISDQSWVSANPATGNGNSTIIFTAENNPNIEKRTATITINAPGIPAKTVTISQESGSVILTLSTYSSTLEAVEGSSSTVTVTSNTSWNIVTSPDWLNITPASGTGNSLVTITAEINNTTAERSDSVIFTTPEGTIRILSVIQEAGSAKISVSETNLNIGGTANSSATFEISSNTTWTISSNQDWLTVSPVSGTGDTTITLIAEANTSKSERTAIVTISATGTDSKTISVTQSAITGFKMITDQDVLIYPNPFTDGIFVKSTSCEMNVTVFDLNGGKIFSGPVSNNGFVPASNLKNGIYLVNVISNGNSIKKTVIKK
jgi:hypothetical protein